MTTTIKQLRLSLNVLLHSSVPFLSQKDTKVLFRKKLIGIGIGSTVKGLEFDLDNYRDGILRQAQHRFGV